MDVADQYQISSLQSLKVPEYTRKDSSIGGQEEVQAVCEDSTDNSGFGWDVFHDKVRKPFPPLQPANLIRILKFEIELTHHPSIWKPSGKKC